jgi:hypothetical protein
VKFKEAVEGTPGVEAAWRPGLQAIERADRRHIDVEDGKCLRGSVNLDAAMKHARPHDPRWDYGVGHQAARNAAEIVYWIEIHPANNRGVAEVLSKLAWLIQWLKDSAPLLRDMPRAYVWVSSGKTSFTLSSPQRKRLAVHGLRHVGRTFKL